MCNAEPGYYEDGKFGIRIENVLLVKNVNTPANFGNVGYYGFENITMVNQNLIIIILFYHHLSYWSYLVSNWYEIIGLFHNYNWRSWST